MAWGQSSIPKPPPPPPQSTLSKTLPLLILIIVLGGAAFVGYHIFLSFQQISDAAGKKLQSKNVTFTKDGMRVGVKELRDENYVDRTQGFLVKAWNLSTWPAYKSKLWNKSNESEVKERKSYSKSGSAAHVK